VAHLGGGFNSKGQEHRRGRREAPCVAPFQPRLEQSEWGLLSKRPFGQTLLSRCDRVRFQVCRVQWISPASVPRPAGLFRAHGGATEQFAAKLKRLLEFRLGKLRPARWASALTGRPPGRAPVAVLNPGGGFCVAAARAARYPRGPNRVNKGLLDSRPSFRDDHDPAPRKRAGFFVLGGAKSVRNTQSRNNLSSRGRSILLRSAPGP
jgi:hypothetical protein